MCFCAIFDKGQYGLTCIVPESNFSKRASKRNKVWAFDGNVWWIFERTIQVRLYVIIWLEFTKNILINVFEKELNISLPNIFQILVWVKLDDNFLWGIFSNWGIGKDLSLFQRLGNVFLNLQLLNMIERVNLFYFYHVISKLLWKPHHAHGPC